MNEQAGIIAITGASGQLGRRVVELLLERVEPGRVLALTRSPEKLADLAAKGVQAAFGDFAQPEALAEALTGVDRLLLISTDAVGARVQQQTGAVAAAARAGVRHIMYTSAVNPHTSPLAFIREHSATERAIEASGLPYTFLRNNLYAEVLLRSAPQVIATGELRAAAGNGAAGYVAREDCARVAAAVLATPGHDRAIYNVTGPTAVTYYDVARELSAVSGRPVRYIPISADEARQDLLNAGLPALWAETLVGMDHAREQGEFNVASSVVRDLTGTAPASIAEVFARYQAALLAPVSSVS